MTSVEFTNQSQFNNLKQKLEEDLGRELSDKEVKDVILEFGFANYNKLLTQVKTKLNDKSPSQEQFDRMKQYIITDVEDTDVSERVDEILYGS